MRLILLTFGFLGWAFYEMSGGSDFESASDRHARLNPAPAVAVEKVDDAPAQTVAQSEIIDTDPPEQTSVTRVSLNLTTLEDASDAAGTAADQTAQAVADAVAEEIANVDAGTGVAINADTITTASADTPAIIPSLILPNDTGAATLQAAAQDVPARDIRTVTGDRVNVRGGPGTDFGVVFKLVQGDSVEVLEDNGDGWVRMRSVSNGNEGWMADWLLNAG